MTNYSSYPDQIDGYSTLPLVKDGITEILATHHNALRDAIVKIEQELGLNPSSDFATVADRLDSINDASATINAHLIDPTDAHDASAISILDTEDHYISLNVEDALAELASILPAQIDVIGADNTSVPNTGIPSFVNHLGTTFVFNTSGGADEVKKTQPVSITGVRILDVGAGNDFGTGTLTFYITPARLTWTAPGDAEGLAVDISALVEGDTFILDSDNTGKKIRLSRTSASLPIGGIAENFNIYSLSAATGSYSIVGTGFQQSNFITRTAISRTGTSRDQFMISGMIFPADKGTLVLQRKLRGSSQFNAVAVLDLSANFNESLRSTGQPAYIPALDLFDSITLFDRQPARKDYETLDLDASGNAIYDNFAITATFGTFQVAKYLIPASNSTLAGGALLAPADSSLGEVNDQVSAYRLVHYLDGETNFNGDPSETQIYSVADALGGGTNDGDNNVRMSNVYLDPFASLSTITDLILSPVVDVEVLEKTISGIHYYNSPDDLFNIELTSSDRIFKQTYLEDDILRFNTHVFAFPSGATYGLNVDVTELMDDAGSFDLYSVSNLPDFSTADHSIAYYLINASYNTSRRIYPDVDKFSAHSGVFATLYDPFGAGVEFTADDAYGYDSGTFTNTIILVNSFDRFRATDTEEFFTDESKRIGSGENFNFALERGQFIHTYGPNTDGYTLDAWDPGVPLIGIDLQCGGLIEEPYSIYPGLVYPQEDYTATNYRPNQFGSVDYSGFSGDMFYQRVFNLGYPISSGKLRIQSTGGSLISFNDMWEGNASRFMKVLVKISGTGPSSTGFLDCGKLYNTNAYEDDDGALVSVSGTEGDFTVSFTLGERNNADSGNMLAIKVTYFGAQYIVARTKILSYLQLLPS